MDILFLLAALIFLFVWNSWIEKRALSPHARELHFSQQQSAYRLDDDPSIDTPPGGASAWGAGVSAERTFVGDVAWLIYCPTIAVGLMLVGMAVLAIWSLSGGPAWTFDLLWPWCGAIVLGVCHHGWSRKRRAEQLTHAATATDARPGEDRA